MPDLFEQISIDYDGISLFDLLKLAPAAYGTLQPWRRIAVIPMQQGTNFGPNVLEHLKTSHDGMFWKKGSLRLDTEGSVHAHSMGRGEMYKFVVPGRSSWFHTGLSKNIVSPPF